MLKYLYTAELFKEVPSELTLGISISGCNIHCLGCHSRELWEDKGTPLTIDSLQKLIAKHQGITCVLLLGGERNIDALTELFQHICGIIKTAWYCGLDRIPKGKERILKYLNYYKLGHYDQELGGLDSPTTNQRMYKVEHQEDGNYLETDITSLFWKNKKTYEN